MIRLLPAGLYTEMPGKRGRDARSGPLSGSGEYDWRISLATIRQPGPFSAFPGYLRNISVLEGGGMYLTIDGQRSALIAPFRALGFNGASGVSCEIVGGPLLDFNVIYREAALRATVSWCGRERGRIRADYGYCLMPGPRCGCASATNAIYWNITTACWWMKRWRWLSRTLRARVWPASR